MRGAVSGGSRILAMVLGVLPKQTLLDFVTGTLNAILKLSQDVSEPVMALAGG